QELCAVGGEEICIIHAGTFNKNQGPDFLHAQIKIGQTVLAGSLEIHCLTSQWDAHGHSDDENYNNVILHVVYLHDKTDSDPLIPVLELEPRISNGLLQKYRSLMMDQQPIHCSGNIAEINELVWMKWIERLVAERLTRKALDITKLLEQTKYHWEEVFWRLLARNFGSRVNGDAFEAIATSLPFNLLTKHRTQIHHLEALLLGQANLLRNDFSESYPRLLAREYFFLQKKYNLIPVATPVHFLRMRPGNFPSLRLAQLAMLLHQQDIFMDFFMKTEDLKSLRAFFNLTPNDFWLYHYMLDEPSSYKKKNLGKETIDNIIINTIIPFVFMYGQYHKDDHLKQKAVRLLNELDAEVNSVTKKFTQLGVPNRTAFHSQALYELLNQYCSAKKCLECSVGYQLLRKGIT
ncbi:MAG: DUF2851 family protein, partial [Flavisolibacter sp.]|nr:DUF2851 family protein [Flavisolibacter sp.]